MVAEHDPTTCVAVSVGQLIAEELFRDSLVAGEEGIDRLVAWCVPGGPDTGTEADLQDVRGAAVFVSSHDLAGCAKDLIPRLADGQASAVLAWPGVGQEHPDLDTAVEVADAVGLPLLRLPSGAAFRDTSQLIATKVLAQSTHVLEYGTRVHRTLGDVFARGAGLTALADTMARISGTDVLVLNRAGELLAQSRDPEHEGVTAELIEEAIERLTDQGFLDDDVAADGDRAARVVTLELGGERRQLVVTRVLVAGLAYGLLVLVEPEYPAVGHDLAQHRVMAEQGVSLTGSELLRQQSVREAEERARNDFVHALLHNRFTDQFELAARAEHYRFPLDGRFAVYIVASPEVRPDDAAGRRRAVDVARAARRTDGDSVALSALIGSMIVVVKHVPDGDSSGDADESARIRHYGEQLLRTASRRLGEDVRVTFGRACDGATGVARSYREARTAEALGKRVGSGSVSAFEDLRVFAALQESARSPAGLAFAREILEPLQQSDGQTGNLESVVLAYIAEAGNLNAAARRLHLHRNTMLYKLERVSRALRMDIRTTEAQFMIWLAHHITALSDIVEQLDEELTPPR